MNAVVCDVCGSSHIETDDSGHTACADCGTQSQQLFAESNDAGDLGFHNNRGATRTLRTTKGAVRTETEYKPTVMDALTAYQTCLQTVAESVQSCLQLPNDYVATVRQLWLSYLRKWASSSRYSILEAFYYAIKRHGLGKTPLPETLLRETSLTISERLLPSLSLMLGLCMLASYMERLTILPIDVQRLVCNGHIPFFNLFDTLPAALRTKVHALRSFFMEQKAPSADKIQYLSLALLKELELKAPPLNEAAVAQRMVDSLGFPERVFKGYMRCRHHLQLKAALGSNNDSAYEIILAKIVVVIKSVMEITETRYLARSVNRRSAAASASSATYEMPRNLRTLELVSRGRLAEYLERLRNLYYKSVALRDRPAGIYRFVKEQLDFIANRTREQFSEELQPCKVFMHPTNPYYLALPPRLQTLYNANFKHTRRLFSTQTILSKSAPGYFYPLHMFLIEYCANAMGVSPRVLHDVVCSIENNVYDGQQKRRNATKKRAALLNPKQVEQRNIRLSIERMKERHINRVTRRIRFAERRKYYSGILPTMKELATRGVLHAQVETQQRGGPREKVQRHVAINKLTSNIRNTFVDEHESTGSVALDTGLTGAQRYALHERIRQHVEVLKDSSTAWRAKRKRDAEVQDEYFMRGTVAASTLQQQGVVDITVKQEHQGHETYMLHHNDSEDDDDLASDGY